MITQIIHYFGLVHGLYDIVCALSLLDLIPLPQVPHLLMLHDQGTERFRRFFAYWIFTYGLMRIHGSMRAYSYFIEALWVAHETWVHRSVRRVWGTYVVVVCCVLGCLTL